MHAQVDLGRPIRPLPLKNIVKEQGRSTDFGIQSRVYTYKNFN